MKFNTAIQFRRCPHSKVCILSCPICKIHGIADLIDGSFLYFEKYLANKDHMVEDVVFSIILVAILDNENDVNKMRLIPKINVLQLWGK